MFNYISEKLKLIAQIYCWIGITGSAIAAVVFFSIKDLALVGLLCLVLGPLFFWISSLLLYSWGELIENVEIIKFRSCGLNSDGSKPEVKHTTTK